MTGAEVERILAEKVLAHPNIRVFENHMGVNLITLERVVRQGRVVTEAERTCLGAYVLNKETGQVDTFLGPPSPCWPRAGSARSISTPATRTSPPATGWPWPIGPGP